MFEGPPKPEVVKKEEDPYAEYADLIAMYETPEIPAEKRVDCDTHVADFRLMVAKYEGSHNCEVLRTVTDLTPKDAPHHPVREIARQDMNEIVALLNFLEEKTNISKEELADLKARYRKLSQAVGMINQGIVDHDR